MLRYPGEFMGAGGTGFETLTDEQRQAWRDVRTNELCRAAFGEATGAAGAFAIPLDLHPDIILTNAGSANPFRQLARNVVATTNVAEFVTSAGSTANWLPEGTAVADTTPTLGQLAITHYKESVWIFGSFEVLQDTALGTQVPALIADAKDRLEVVAFTTGTGSAQPFGIITHGTSDATVGRADRGDGLRAAPGAAAPVPGRGRREAGVAGQRGDHQRAAADPELHRGGHVDGERQPGRQHPGGAVASTSWRTRRWTRPTSCRGHKNLAILDMNSFIITNRQPELLIYEPLFKDQATGRPIGSGRVVLLVAAPGRT